MKKNLLNIICFSIMTGSLLLSACGNSVTPSHVVEFTDTPVPTLTATAIPPTITPIPTLVPMNDFMKGISYVQWDRGGFTSEASDTLLGQSIPQMGATWISLIVTCNQKTIDSTEIFCDRGPSDREVIHAIQTAHAAGLRVMLKPHLDLSEDFSHWRGEIGKSFDQSQWQVWFESYTAYITHFAKIAQDQNVDAFVVGTEMVTPSTHDQEWRNIVLAVRALYAGPLTYAGFENEFTITWWDALDMIGVDAYYPLSNSASPTVEELVKGWQPIAAKLDDLSKRWNKPILFTEIGYESLDKVSNTGGGAPWSNELDLQEQADCYSAAFQVFSERTWWRGAFWWAMDTNAAQGGVYDNGWTPLGKPAEDVLRQYYGASARVQIPLVPDDTLLIHQIETVYDDGFLPGWEDWSWGVEINPLFKDQPYEGGYSMSLTYHDNQWDTLSIHHEPFDLSEYNWLEFYIWSQNDSHCALRVELISAQDDLSYFRMPLVFDPNYIEGSQRQAGTWQRIRIPISSLAPKNSQITRLNIALDGQTGVQVKIDQIRFLKTE
jgi:hypothetical protein